MAPLAVAMLVLVGCGPDLPAAPAVLDVSMGEYRFDYATPVPPGRVDVRAANVGQVDHELVLVVLPPDFPLTIDEQLRGDERQAFPTRAYLPPRPPGARGTFAVDLEPGRYALICFVPGPDGEAHARKGMSSEFRVGS